MTSVVILPESNQTTLCLQLHDQVTADDFDHYYHQEIKKRIAANGYFNMIVTYSADYKGWEPDAADLNLKSILELGNKPHKLAYVNPPKRKILLMKMAEPLLKGEIRYFEEGQYEDALKWIKE
ncbi:MAG: hypothetical protein JWO78_869 [Micavibrio sp.]|nr:hypothetical protein [Micavibrio sp.]